MVYIFIYYIMCNEAMLNQIYVITWCSLSFNESVIISRPEQNDSVKNKTIYHARDLWNWVALINNCVYYARQTHVFYHLLPYSVDFQAPGSFEIHWVRQYLVNVVLFGIEEM